MDVRLSESHERDVSALVAEILPQFPPQPPASDPSDSGVSGPLNDRLSGFICTYRGCGKSFKRKDHLSRHAANHETTSFFCSKCKRGFKRQDLLQRHERRTACRDERSTSPGAGPSRGEVGSEAETSAGVSTTSPTVAAPRSSQPQSLLPPISTTFEFPPIVPANVTIDPRELDNRLETSGSGITLPAELSLGSAAPGFELSLTQGWEGTSWQPDPWESMLKEYGSSTLNMELDAPVSENQPMTRASVSVTEAALLALINATMPELGWDANFLVKALDNYWSNVAPTFPFIHRGTFDFESVTPQLVAMMAILGTRHMNLVPARDFLNVVRKIRADLIHQCGFDMPVATLQAFCLCHVYDTWYGTTETQFVAQCMWPVMVAYTRKKGTSVAGRPENEADEEEAWVAWAKDEERQRAVFSVLLCDTQISAFWNQHCSRQLSIFAHNISLPCPRGQWEAQTASEWISLRQRPTAQHSPTSAMRQSRSGFLPGLHPEFHVNTVTEGYSASILSALATEPSLPFSVNMESYFGVEMILMGLMAAAWDCRTRGAMGIKFGDGTKQWRPIIFKALVNLRATWEKHVMGTPGGAPVKDLRDTFAICVISVLSDIPMLQVAAGSTTISGAIIGRRQYKDAQRRLRIWGKTDDAWTCLWQSARYLRQVLFGDWGLYTSWAVYLTILVHWAYGWAETSDADQIPPPTYNPHSRTNVLLDVILSSSCRLEIAHRGINDLVVCAAERLVNSSIDRECATLLWRLVGSNYTKRPVI